MGKETQYVMVRLPSGGMKKYWQSVWLLLVLLEMKWANVVIGKAIRNRHRGIRPQTRGSAALGTYPDDHWL